LYKKYGSKLVVAIENHPHVVATILTTWKLGGVVAPLDHNAPKDIMKQMLWKLGRLLLWSLRLRAMFKKSFEVNFYLPSSFN
jgi:hypothetical protein